MCLKCKFKFPYDTSFPFLVCRLVGRLDMMSVIPKRAGGYTSMLLTESLFMQLFRYKSTQPPDGGWLGGPERGFKHPGHHPSGAQGGSCLPEDLPGGHGRI